MNLQMWDLGGDKRFAAMTPLYCRGANGAIIVFDIGDSSSVYSAKMWYSTVRKDIQAAGGVPIVMFLANKSDEAARADYRAISDECAEDVLGIREVSAQTGEGINEAVTEFLECLWDRVPGQLSKVGNPGSIRLEDRKDGLSTGNSAGTGRSGRICCQ